MAPSRRTGRRRPANWLGVGLMTLLALASSVARAESRRFPQKRFYDSHVYYVLEARDGATHGADVLARELGVELVEQVGELDRHWLVRAEKELVARGLGDDRPTRRGLDGGPVERDAIMERYHALASADSIQRRSRSGVSPRSVHSSIASLERQELRKRAKRDHAYVVRQDGTIGPADVSDPPKVSYSQTIATKFGLLDPLWPKQWHLANDDVQAYAVNVTDQWAGDVTGRGIKVAIVDDGLDMHSDDLKDNFFAEGSWDYNDHTPLPEPRLSDDQHGTRCAGEIAAQRNEVCGVGVAFDAKVAGIRILSASISDADEASALNYGYQENDIYSCSWGPPDDGKSMEAPSRLIFKAILNGVQKGRGGKGSIFVFASGNGGAVDDQCNFDGYTNSIYSITVSAIDRKESHPYYSEVCSANMVVTYSSGSGDNIHTTDVGKNKCTDRHGGTSAAAPLGAGIFALALQVRPELTWRDMQHLAVNTAVHIVPDDPDWQTTATGRPYNHKFGFGKLDAWAIVEAAKTWKLVKPQAWYMTPNVAADAFISETGATSSIEVTRQQLADANFERLEHITVAVNIVHGRRGNVEVILTSPHGTHSVLARPRRYDEATSGFPGWVFMSVKHWGEDAVGTWTLRVLDKQDNGRNGTFQNWAMGLWGECADASKQELFKMPDDAQIHLPPSPTVTESLPIETDTDVFASTDVTTSRPTKVGPQNPPPAVSDSDVQTSKTKTIVRPTAHLPGDHGAAATTSSPLGAGALVSTSSTRPAPTLLGDEDDLAYLDGGMRGILRRTSPWVFITAGTVIILAGGAVAFFLLRRRQRMRKAGGSRPRGYEFEPVAGDEDMAMGSMERGNGHRHLGAPNGSGGGKTRDLYDAFGVGSDSDDEAGDDLDAGRERVPRLREDDMDDQYMDSFLSDDPNSLAAATTENYSTASLPRREDEPRSRPSHSSSKQGEEARPLFDVGDEE